MADDTPTEATKRCSHCKKTKPLPQFGVSRCQKDGLNPYCKPCKAQFRRREYLRVLEERRYGVQLELELNLKVCPKCKTARLYSAFGADKTRKNGLAPYCKRCSSEMSADMFARNPDVFIARTVRWRAANRLLVAEIARRRLARKRDATLVPFTKEQLNAKWDYWGRKCWICGISAAATDHVKPLAKGGAHMLCNQRPICQPCNSRKNDQWPFDLEWIRRGK